MDNYSKIYVKYYGSSNVHGNYIHPGGKFKNKWKKDLDLPLNVIDNNFKTRGPGSIKITVPTSSRPQTNLPNGYIVSKAEQENNQRASRGVPSVTNYTDYNKTTLAIIGRYSGIYSSARVKTGPLNPIKHWRKQLQPSQGYITGKPSLNQIMWNPGGTTHLGDIDTSCCDTTGKTILSEYLLNKFIDNNNCNCDNNNQENIIRNELSNFQPITFNNPARIIRPRSSQTLIKKNYYTTSSAYLKSRVKTYEQNQLLSKIENNYLIMNNGLDIDIGRAPANNNWVYASNNSNSKLTYTTGSQSFNSTNCVTDPSACCNLNNNCQVPVIFKPNNPFYGVQGAVDSSTRIQQAKYNAITKNNYDFTRYSPNIAGIGLQVNSIAGDKNSEIIRLPGATPIKYRGDSYRNMAPYFVKSKYQRINACYQNIFNYQVSTHIRVRLNGIGNRQPSGGTGTLTTCFYNK